MKVWLNRRKGVDMRVGRLDGLCAQLASSAQSKLSCTGWCDYGSDRLD